MTKMFKSAPNERISLMSKEVKKTPAEELRDEYLEAVRALQRARSNFNNADPDYFDLANQELSTATERVSLLNKQLKKMQVTA